MHDPGFDAYAASYESPHAHSIRFSGDTTDFFAAYKVAVVAAERPEPPGGFQVLDFGGGVANSIAHFRRLFPASRLSLADTSARSLKVAGERFPGEAELCHLEGARLPFFTASFDIVFAACVFHHIPADQHVPLMAELRRVLRPGGSLFVFEHNPYNPLTRKAVRDCPFDEDAVLIPARLLGRRLAQAGFSATALRYRLFFPHALRSLRPYEPWLGRLPLGGQYFAHSRR